MALGDRITKIVDTITRLPGEVARRADDINDQAIEYARDLENALKASGEIAEDNLRRNKIDSLGRDFAGWIQSGQGMQIIIGGVLLIGIISILIIWGKK